MTNRRDRTGGTSSDLRALGWSSTHLAGATSVSRYELAKHAIEADPKHIARIEPVPSEAFPTPAARRRNVVLDCSRARQTFGIELPGYADAFARAFRHE